MPILLLIFVNYEKCPDFVEKLLDWFYKTEYDSNYRTSSGGLNCGRPNAPIKYSLRSGDQHTIYLGTTRSNRLVRIYNKLMQYQKNGVIVKPLPFPENMDVKSWFRIEFQTRKVEASKYLFGFNRFEDILKIIFNDYLIRDKQGNPLIFFLIYMIGAVYRKLRIMLLLQNLIYLHIEIYKIYYSFAKSGTLLCL